MSQAAPPMPPMPPPGMGGQAPTMGPQEANLRPAAPGGPSCAMCVNFQPPNACAVVQGPVDPTMVSDAFIPMDGGAAAAPPGAPPPGGSPDELLKMMGLQ